MGKSLAVKYRPQHLKDVAGQDDAKALLQPMLDDPSTLPGALLITGDTGLGKTTISRIIARTLNCENGTGCGECSSCKIFDTNSDNHPDFKEVNAANARGIDDIRELIELSHYQPRHGMRIILLDEAHQLTPQAMQALLKDLEEPSEYTLWIIATTNPEKLPKTIPNRTQPVRLKRIETKTLAKRLAYIAKKEKFKIDSKILIQIVENCGGGGRDSVAMLETLMHKCKGKRGKDMEKILEDSFVNSDNQKLAHAAALLLLCMYEGDKVNLVRVLPEIEDMSAMVSKLPYMNGFIIYKIMQMINKEAANPYYPTFENKMIWDAIYDAHIKANKKSAGTILTNAIKATHKIKKLRDELFSTTYPDPISLAMTCLMDEPATFTKVASDDAPAKKKKKK